jgi:hypothetical protein
MKPLSLKTELLSGKSHPEIENRLKKIAHAGHTLKRGCSRMGTAS